MSMIHHLIYDYQFFPTCFRIRCSWKCENHSENVLNFKVPGDQKADNETVHGDL